MDNPEKQDFKEQRIRRITNLYYSRADVQKAIFSFSQNREVVPRYFEGFGKRPDSLQYPGDIFELVRKGATSFHCSQELWSDPLKISIDKNEKQMADLRTGWDFLLDIDSKYLDYSKVLAEIIVKILRFYGIKNLGLKFSGSKGFHIIIPWKAFPKEINNMQTSAMFPEWPRILTQFIMELSKKELTEKITGLTIGETESLKYVKDFQAPKEVMPDLILVSSRHLFRMPYSLHEKTALASLVLSPEELRNFQPKDADPLKVQVRNFLPDSEEGEATKLLREALDWYKNKNPEKDLQDSKSIQGYNKSSDFKPIQITNFSDDFLPPTIKKILEGMKDGRKRSLFILLNFFRGIGIERKELESRIFSWNEKNEVPLKGGYIKAQISWSYRNKVAPPPNYESDYYKNLGIVPTEEEIKCKNPLGFVARKQRREEYKKNQDFSGKMRKRRTSE